MPNACQNPSRHRLQCRSGRVGGPVWQTTSLTLNRHRASLPGHIGGTSAREMPRSAEKCRDLSRRSRTRPGASAEVTGTPAQDPAYRPTYERCVNLKGSESVGLANYVTPRRAVRHHPPLDRVGPIRRMLDERHQLRRSLPPIGVTACKKRARVRFQSPRTFMPTTPAATV